MKSNVLLAVTSEQKYLCDVVDRVVFTHGDWAEEGMQWAKDRQIACEVLPPKWNDCRKIRAANAYVERMAIELSHKITKDLNTIHHVSFRPKDWEAALHTWLVSWISAFYDKYNDLLQAGVREDLCLVGESELCIVNNLNEYKVAMNDVGFNVQQYTALMNYFGCQLIDRTGKKIEKIRYVQNEPTVKARMMNRRIRSFLQNGLHGVRLILDNELQDVIGSFVVKATKGAVQFINGAYLYYSESRVNMDMREKLNQTIRTDDDFEKFIYENIGYFIPVIYLEGFHEIWPVIDTMEELQAVVLRYPFDYSEVLTALSLKARGNQGKIYHIQHGGMGIEKYIGTDTIKYADVFYSWGWREEEYQNTFKKMPSTKISREKDKIIRLQKTREILFVENLSKYRIFRFNDYYDSNKWESMRKEDDFVRRLKGSVFPRLTVRPYLGCEEGRAQYLSRVHPGIRVSRPGILYTEALSKARIVVLQGMITTWLEALAANIPFLIIMNRKHIFYAGKGVVEDIRLMKKAGILQESPEAAADFINRNYNEIETWWKSRQTQRVVKRLRKKYAKASCLYRLRWKLEILKIVFAVNRKK